MRQIEIEPHLFHALTKGDIEAVHLSMNDRPDRINAVGDFVCKLRTVLGIAAYCGHLEIVTYLLVQGADPNGIEGKITRPLHDATMSGNPEIVRALLAAGADADITDEDGSDVLATAAMASYIWPEREYTTTVRLLIDAGCDVSHIAKNSTTALTTLASRFPATSNMLALARVLVESGLPVNAREERDGETALIAAAACGNIEVVRLLIESGASVNLQNADGDTAWNAAARGGHTQIAELLLHSGAEEPAKVTLDLHRAILWGKTSSVGDLLDTGSDANSVNRIGQPALIAAVEFGGNEEIVRSLLDHGADVNAAGVNCLSALECVLYQCDNRTPNCASIVRLLLERGANIPPPPDWGDPFLHMAACHEDPEITRMILDAGADVNIRDIYKRTALDVASDSQKTGLIKILKSAGAIHGEGSSGKTFCYYAMEDG